MITPDKKKIYGGPGILALLNITRITPEEAEIINKREKEPVSAPKVPYPLQPGNYSQCEFLLKNGIGKTCL